MDKLKAVTPYGPSAIHGTQVTIELLHGFELFNTSSYHNYETWSKGYRISGYDVVVEKEELQDAIDFWCEKYKEKMSLQKQ